MLFVLRLSECPPVFQQEVFSALEDVLVALRGFPVFAVKHFVLSGYHMVSSLKAVFGSGGAVTQLHGLQLRKLRVLSCVNLKSPLKIIINSLS